MDIKINENNLWYHGSNKLFEILEEGSTITQWLKLAEAFSHKPAGLCYDEDEVILHNGEEIGYLYIIDEPIKVSVDIYQHPRTTMDKNAEFLTKRPLRVKLVKKLDALSTDELKRINDLFDKMIMDK